MCVCECVCVTEVGCSWSGTRLVSVTLYIQFTEPRNSVKNVREHGGYKWMHAIGEPQSKRTQLRSCSSAQRAVRCRITHVGERGGSS